MLDRCVAAWVLGLASGLALAQPAFNCPDGEGDHAGHQGCGKSAMLRLRLAQGLQVTDPEPLLDQAEALGDTDVQHVGLELEFFTANTTLTGTCTTTIKSLASGLNVFTIRLRSNFTITSATVNGVAVTVTTIDTSTRRVNLDRAYNSGEVFTLVIAYNGPVVSRGLGSISFTSQNGVPLVASLSEPYYAYTWWPAKDGAFAQAGDNADKFTANVSVITPNNLTGISNGVRQGIDVLPNNRLRHRWATSYPMSTYLLCFAATNYTTWRQIYTYPGGTMPVDFYIYPTSDTPANRAGWEVVVPALDVFKDVYGLYPFINEKYGIYQFPFNGGMEHQTMTGQGTFNQSVSAHELMHQWWGNDVTCRTWSDIWINEGNATYGEALWAERRPGSTGLPALRQAMLDRKPTGFDSVYIPPTTSMSEGRIFAYDTSYAKGAWVLHMLRKVVGDAAFFQAQRDVRALWSGGALTTDQYRDTLSQSTGRDLTQFFDQWVHGTGVPTYTSGVQPLVVNGKNYARVQIRQTQSTAYGAGGFDMPIDVRIDTGAGPTTVTLLNNEPLEWFVRPVPAAPTAVTLDPSDWVLNYGKTAEAVLPAPPVIVETSPAPLSQTPAAASPSSIVIYFSDPVNAAPANFTLAGGSTVEPMTFAYSAADRRVTLTRVGGPLAPGTYSLTVAAVRGTASGLDLDGDAGQGLPSGDGLPGGTALINFTINVPVVPNCPADYNLDGTVNQEDLSPFITDFLSEPFPPAGPGGYATAPCFGETAPFDTLGYQPDFNRDCTINQEDLSGYITAYFEPCG